MLGLGLEESWAAIVGLPTTEPLKVTSVTNESARKLNVQQGDLIYAVAGKAITSVVDLNELLKVLSSRAGDRSHAAIWRRHRYKKDYFNRGQIKATALNAKEERSTK